MVIAGFKVIKDFTDPAILLNQKTNPMLVYAP
jgi:hypothetical protein